MDPACHDVEFALEEERRPSLRRRQLLTVSERQAQVMLEENVDGARELTVKVQRTRGQ